VRSGSFVHGRARFPTVGTYGTDYLARAATAKIGLGANVAEESVYYVAASDVHGQALSGQTPYRLRFAADQLPPVGTHGFWSVTVYNADRFLVANPIDRYSIGDRTPGLRRNDDGSLDVDLRAHSPGGHRPNWLPTPAGPFTLVMRIYVPDAAVLDGSWTPAGVTPLS